MMRTISVLIVLASVGVASADRIDDEIAKTDKLWSHYAEVRDHYSLAYDKHKLLYGPIEAQWQVVIAAKKAMDTTCATQHGKQPCSDATLKWAAEVKKRQSLEWHAAEVDPKKEFTTDALNLLNIDYQKAKTDFESSRDHTLKLITDAEAKAGSAADRDKIAAKLGQRQSKQDQKFASTRGSAAESRAPKGGGNSSSGSSSCHLCGKTAPTGVTWGE